MFEVLKVWTLAGGGLVVESLPGDRLKIVFHFSPEIGNQIENLVTTKDYMVKDVTQNTRGVCKGSPH